MDQSGPGGDDSQRVIHILQSFRTSYIPETTQTDSMCQEKKEE